MNQQLVAEHPIAEHAVAGHTVVAQKAVAVNTPTAEQRQTLELTLTINGCTRTAPAVPVRSSLLTALREDFALPGAKNACEQGECGSCTVYLDGAPVCSCLVAAGQAAGREVCTVEGLADDGVPDAVQRAFVACGAVQCGFCTPGLVVAVHDLVHRKLIDRDPEADGGPSQDAVIRESLAGNLCRCTGYEKIIDAVRHATDELRAERAREQVAS